MGIILIISLISSAPRTVANEVNIVELVPTINDFGFRIFPVLAQSPVKDNVFISPYSIATALKMTYNGAGTETREAMARCLGISEIPVAQLNAGEQMLAERLMNIDPKVELIIANSLWARKEITFNRKFLDVNRNFYRAEITALEFEDPNTADKINNWVKNKTRGKINKIVDRIKPEAVLFLINAIYFKGKWQNQFDQQDTRDDDFYLTDGMRQQVKMMRQSARFNYLETDDFQAVELPYGNGRTSMFIFLPRETVGLDGFLKRLTLDNWQVWLSLFVSREGELLLPRFKMEYKTSLNDALTQLGMGIAFDLERADFSLMGTGQRRFAIGDVKHKSFVEVNEEGTEAAAVTSVEMVLAAVPQNRFRMVVNRPFFFLIRDNEMGTVLFLGAVVNPGRG